MAKVGEIPSRNGFMKLAMNDVAATKGGFE